MADTDQSLYTIRYNQITQGMEGFGGGSPMWTPLILSADGGINRLTGDVTAGPGSGSQVATLANTAVTPGSYTSANITVDSKGRITAASNGSGGSGTPGGANTDIQFNNSGAFGGSANLTYDGTTLHAAAVGQFISDSEPSFTIQSSDGTRGIRIDTTTSAQPQLSMFDVLADSSIALSVYAIGAFPMGILINNDNVSTPNTGISLALNSLTNTGWSIIRTPSSGYGDLRLQTADAEIVAITMKEAGNVGINNSTPDASAILDVASTTQGFLLPRMTTTERNAISSPAEGLLVYDTTLHQLWAHENGAWAQVGGGGGSSPNTAQTINSTTDFFTTNSSIFVDTTLGVTITPSSSSAKLLITVSMNEQHSGNANVWYTVFRGVGGTNLAGGTNAIMCQFSQGGSGPMGASFSITDAPATTSPVTYEVYVRTDGGTWRGNDSATICLINATEIH